MFRSSDADNDYSRLNLINGCLIPRSDSGSTSESAEVSTVASQQAGLKLVETAGSLGLFYMDLFFPMPVLVSFRGPKFTLLL